MLDHLGDLLRTQVLKKEKELIDKQIEEAEKQAGKRVLRDFEQATLSDGNAIQLEVFQVNHLVLSGQTIPELKFVRTVLVLREK